MDTLLVNGDFQKNSRGFLIPIYGEQELLQRALIRLVVKKGSFPFDENLGSELYRLRRTDKKLLERTALGYVQDALYSMSELFVSLVTCDYNQGLDRVQVSVELTIKNKNHMLEVTI